jgi:broad specificity phosphatase PhoE
VTTTPPTTVRPTPQRHRHLRHPAAGETTLYLVRHGRTTSNVRRLLHGVTDVPLDRFGLRQAARVAERLEQEPAVDAVLSSPLSRALSTARIIGERIGKEPIVVPELVEMDFGALEGATFERIVEDHPTLAERLFDLDADDVAWPEGETRRGFNDRVRAAFLAILADYAAHRVVVVAHGGVIGTFLGGIQGLSPNDPTIYDVMNCSLTHLHVTPEETVLHVRNDVVHLESLVDDEPTAAACD